MQVRDLTFQSHLGSISTQGSPTRLATASRFQSHLGSISTRRGRQFEAAVAGFNPTLVRLAHCSSPGDGVSMAVSIPPWFD